MGTAVDQNNTVQDTQDNQSTPQGDFDSQRIEVMGKEVVDTMRGLRELLDARAKALEACRTALVEHYRELDQERDAFGTEQLELCERIEKREAELEAREKECESLKAQAQQLAAFQKAQLEELQNRDEQASSRLADMDKQVEALCQRESAASAALQKVDEQRITLEQERLNFEEAQKRIGETSARVEEERSLVAQKHQEIVKAEEQVVSQQQQLSEQQRAFVNQQNAAAQERKATETRQLELENIASQLEAGRHELASQQQSLAASQSEWDVKLRELQTASASLSSLQKHLDGELTSISDQADELLPQYGVTRESANRGAPADQGMPSATDQAATDSLERFQKLCRDAKRRAIG